MRKSLRISCFSFIRPHGNSKNKCLPRAFTVLFLGILSVLAPNQSGAQSKRNNIWYFGDKAGISFANGVPVALNVGMNNFSEGCATICDTSGSLLFYTGSGSVFNRMHSAMSNSNGIRINSSSTQGPLIVPYPGICSRYFIFAAPVQRSMDLQGDFAVPRYSIVDMNLNGGLGEVIQKNTDLPVPPDEVWTEKVTSVLHSNKTDTWVIFLALSGDIYSFLVTGAGLDPTPVVSSGPAPGCFIGQMKASPRGDRLAAATLFDVCPLNEPTTRVLVYNFDNSTGVASFSFGLSDGHVAYGLSFSPDGTKLYTSSEENMPDRHFSTKGLFQYDLNAGSNAQIESSRVQIDNKFGGAASMEIGPDGKIFVARNNQPRIGVINNPNAAGMACNYNRFGLGLAAGTKSVFGLQNISLGGINPVTVISTVKGDVSCNGGNDGFAEVNVPGDPALYKFKWAPGGQTTRSVSGLAAGIYSVTVTNPCDSNIFTSVTINEPDSIKISASIVHTTICGQPFGNGSATAYPSGGTPGPGYIYIWQTLPPQLTQTAGNLSNGTYRVTVTDSRGCSSSMDVNINCASAVPLALLDFKAVRSDSEVLLSWSAIPESSSGHFAIERSSDGIKYTPFRTVSCTVNSPAVEKYDLRDTDPFPGVSYYRIRQIDINGQAGPSRIASIGAGFSHTLAITPNPVPGGNDLKISYSTEEKGTAELRVYNLMGQQLYYRENNLEGQSMSVSLGNIPAGQYILEFKTASFVEKRKLVVE